MKRYRLSITPPGGIDPRPLHLMPGDSVTATVKTDELTWVSCWTANEETWLEFTNWEEVE